MQLRKGPPGMDGKQGFATPEQLLKRYEQLGVSKAVLLPIVSPECLYIHQSNEEIFTVFERWPNFFIPFCNIDPRAMTNSPDAPLNHLLSFYKEKGFKGVGEITANLPFNHFMVDNLFKHCEKLNMPVLFHVAASLGNDYGLYDEPDLPLLKRALRRYPNLIFIGHSPVFWAEIAPLNTIGSRSTYPKDSFKEEGAVPKLMRKYPNLYGDLSARSGYNAICRNLEFGCEFMEEFKDKLLFGTDICAPDTPAPLANYLLNLKDQGKISGECFDKISHENAIRMLNL